MEGSLGNHLESFVSTKSEMCNFAMIKNHKNGPTALTIDLRVKGPITNPLNNFWSTCLLQSLESENSTSAIDIIIVMDLRAKRWITNPLPLPAPPNCSKAWPPTHYWPPTIWGLSVFYSWWNHEILRQKITKLKKKKFLPTSYQVKFVDPWYVYFLVDVLIWSILQKYCFRLRYFWDVEIT